MKFSIKAKIIITDENGYTKEFTEENITNIEVEEPIQENTFLTGTFRRVVKNCS